MTYLIGMDNGGTVSKAALFSPDGTQLAVAARQTPLITPQPGYVERDMEALWQANCACLREVVQTAGVNPKDIAAVAITGHGKGLYAWGKGGGPACNGIVSTDNRAWAYPDRWRKDGTFESLYPRLCQQLIPSQPAALLAWMKEHRRAVYEDIEWVFSVKDYIRFRLTGKAFFERTDLSGSGLMDVKNNIVAADLLEALGIGEMAACIPPVRDSFDHCGAVTAEASERTGLPAGTPAAGGMFDIDACAIGMDITDERQLCTITGTWTINEYISRTPVLGTGIAMNSLYAIPGYYLIEECSPTGAGNLDWVMDMLLGGTAFADNAARYCHVDELVASVDPAKSDVYFLPFLNGSNQHPLAKGSFLGLTRFHTKADMLRAVYEGVAYSAKTHIDRLLTARAMPSAIRMAGGAVHSPVWVRLFADVLGCPVETAGGVEELGALGAAMAAAVAAGCFPDYPAAAQAMVHIGARVLPDAARTAVYREKYETYRALNHALDQIWQRFEV